MRWDGSVAIVTGASSGIGFAVARKLVQRGARVALVARTASRLDAVVGELGRERTEAYPRDVSDKEALSVLPRRVVDRFGRLDVLVNNAGVNHRGAVRARSSAELDAILETNLGAPIRLTHAALPFFGDGSVIVNVASLAGKVPVPHEATYSATKSGLRAFSRALGTELSSDGVRVITVCPGPVDTGFFGDVSSVPDIVFSQPMSTADRVADAVLRAIESSDGEVDVPVLSGKLATLGYLSPRLFTKLRPVLEKIGQRKKRQFLARKR